MVGSQTESILVFNVVFNDITVVDPGFPVGGHGPRSGGWTPEAATFRKICMSKRKNRVP